MLNVVLLLACHVTGCLVSLTLVILFANELLVDKLPGGGRTDFADYSKLISYFVTSRYIVKSKINEKTNYTIELILATL